MQEQKKRNGSIRHTCRQVEVPGTPSRLSEELNELYEVGLGHPVSFLVRGVDPGEARGDVLANLHRLGSNSSESKYENGSWSLKVHSRMFMVL